ncbi:MAG: bifunctional rhamnulose-1-phosphate aldolase/short-chain dehydrogenase [Chloroflexi bacterium]|nr:bifunctional rhamnulose-1-phosphate aldolase/short-chain dehydrogenase [Chloroflexota bacterium]
MAIAPSSSVDAEVEALIARSHALGADPRVTNFAGGNTSVKLPGVDPATGELVTLLYIKGSGGDLGTLTRPGLAVLNLDRILASRGRYRGVAYEDEMFPLLEHHCCFGPQTAAPSIDTASHAFVPARHVDHVHPDAIIAFATAADGERLTRECFGGEVAWIPWQRPGFELAMMMEAAHRPGVKGMVLGGHGLSSWADTSDDCHRTTLEIIARAERFIVERGRPDPLGAVVPGREPLPPAERRRLAADLAPLIRGLCSTDKHVVGHFDDSDAVLDFIAREKAPALSRKGTSCPDHFLRTKIRPLFLDLPPSSSRDAIAARLRELHAEYRDEYAAYYARHATPDSPAMRGADPAIVLVPGVGMFSYGADAQTARVSGEFYVNAIDVMRGAEALSTYEPIPESEKFRVEYWSLEEAKLRRRPPAKPLTGKVALVTGAASGIGRAIAERLAAEGAAVVIADLDAAGAAKVADQLGGRDRATGLLVDVRDENAVDEAMRFACLAYGGVDIVVNNAGLSQSAPLIETTVESWDLQHRVMARGSFLVSRAAARVMIEQGRGGDLVYVVSKNAVFAGPNNVAYGAAKADQAHQVRLLAAELGEHRIRVNGVNPDAVVRGSGIFAGDWGDQRAAVYGVPREDLGRFYAERTLLKQEVLPEHIAAAVYTLVSGALRLTTGTIIPVDGGVPGAFLR